MADPVLTKSVASLQSRWSGFKRAFWARRAVVTAIDLDGSLLNVVQAVQRFGRTRVTRFAAERLELGEGETADVKARGEAIAATLRRLGLKAGQVVMGIPRASVVLRTLSLPKANSGSDMAAMVRFQISKDLPFRLEDAVVDYKVLAERVETPASPAAPEPPSGEGTPADNLQVLVAAVKKEVLAEYQQLALAAGLRLTSLGLSSYANARCVDLCDLDESDHCLALVSLRPDELVIDVLNNRELVFSRMASLRPPTAPGEEDVEEPVRGGRSREEPFAVEHVTIEVVRSLHSYEGMEHHDRVTHIFLAGMKQGTQAVADELHRRLRIPSEILDPARILKLADADQAQASGAIAAFGLAFGMFDPAGLPFDFLNPKRPSPPGLGKRTRMLLLAVGVSLLALSVLGVRSFLVHRRQVVKDSLQSQLTAATKSRPLYRQARLQEKTVKDWLAEDRRWLDHLAFLSSLLPSSEHLYVTSLGTGARGAIHLSVKARGGEIITRLDTRLRQAGYDVKPPAVTPSSDRYGYGFQANFELEIPRKMKIELAKLQYPARLEDDASLDGRKPPRGGAKPAPVSPPAPAPAPAAASAAPAAPAAAVAAPEPSPPAAKAAPAPEQRRFRKRVDGERKARP